MTKKTRNCFFALCIVALPFLIFLGFLIYYLLVPPLPPIQPLPNPNGYNDLVKAGQMVMNGTSDDNTISMEELQQRVGNNSNALQLARSGLEEQCCVPLEFSQSYMNNHLDDLSSLKQLANAFEAEGILASRENRPGDAVKSYLDIFRLGNDTARGGVLIDQLVGTAIEAVATIYGIQKIADQLDVGSCRETAATLETLDSQRQTWDEVMQQENDWSRRTFTGFRYEIMRLMDSKSMEKMFQKAEQKYKEQQIKTRQLTIDLAARAYELDKGKPPTSVSDLVPDYLKAVPQDPFTGTNMAYSPR